jgi:hypothetical protein
MQFGRGFQRYQRKKVLIVSTFKNRPILPLSDPDWIASGDPYSCEGLTQGGPVRYRGPRLFRFSA